MLSQAGLGGAGAGNAVALKEAEPSLAKVEPNIAHHETRGLLLDHAIETIRTDLLDFGELPPGGWSE